MRAFWEKHKSFFSTIYTVSFYIGTIYGFLQVLKTIFDSLRTGNFLAFVIAIIFNSVIATMNGIIFTLVWGTIACIVLLIPYLIIRGLFH